MFSTLHLLWCSGQSRAEGESIAVRGPKPTTCSPDRPVQEKSHRDGADQQKRAARHDDARQERQTPSENHQF